MASLCPRPEKVVHEGKPPKDWLIGATRRAREATVQQLAKWVRRGRVQLAACERQDQKAGGRMSLSTRMYHLMLDVLMTEAERRNAVQ